MREVAVKGQVLVEKENPSKIQLNNLYNITKKRGKLIRLFIIQFRFNK